MDDVDAADAVDLGDVGLGELGGPLLVGVDGSVAGRAALTWAMTRARELHADVELVIVADDEGGMIGQTRLHELHAAAKEKGEREREYALRLGAPAGLRLVLGFGNPMQTLSEESRGFALVVIGTHKIGYHHGYAFGSRSLQLAAQVMVPMAVIPVESVLRRSGVVVGVDDSPGWRAVVRFGAHEAVRRGEPLLLLRREREDGRDQQLSEATRLVERMTPRPRIEVHRAAVRPGEALAAASRRAVIIVNGLPMIEGDRARPLGRTNVDLLLNLAGPTILVPQLVAEAS